MRELVDGGNLPWEYLRQNICTSRRLQNIIQEEQMPKA